MTLRKLALSLPVVLVLVTCTSCQLSQLSQLDQNGDGEITPDEVIMAAVDFVCGAQMDSSTTGVSTTGDNSASTNPTSDGASTGNAAN